MKAPHPFIFAGCCVIVLCLGVATSIPMSDYGDRKISAPMPPRPACEVRLLKKGDPASRVLALCGEPHTKTRYSYIGLEQVVRHEQWQYGNMFGLHQEVYLDDGLVSNWQEFEEE